jgi:periplasmic divalent cation tolerance protein
VTQKQAGGKRPMAKSGYVIIFITASSYEEARKVADALVTQKKAACVNIVPKVNSLFRWKGKIEDAEENLLVVKTRAKLLSEVVSTVKAVHSYEVPEIIALPIIEGNPDYLKWIDEETE